ncbi:hypothetical protein D3C81_585820 [compost metagenome]
MPSRVGVDKPLKACLAQLAACQPCPELAGEGIQRRQPHLQGQRQLTAMGGLVLCRGHWSAGREGGYGGQVRCDHRSGGAPGDQVALPYQQLVSRLHRASRQVQLRRQRAHCRYPVAWAQAAVGDGLTEAVIELTIDRL